MSVNNTNRWRLSVLSKKQRLLLFIITFLILYPLEVLIIILSNLKDSIFDFFKYSFIELKDETLPWIKTYKHLMEK